MCTIMTIDQKFWNKNARAVIDQIREDAEYNSEGWNLIGLDPKNPDNDFQTSTMKVNFIPNLIKTFFHHSSKEARIFLHARAATGPNVGIAFNHGFTDFQGRMIMHNGIIRNVDKLSVDSHNLATVYDLESAESLRDGLLEAGERFANIFVIDTQIGVYSVVRMMTGSLYTDGLGNFSTNPIGTIFESVKAEYAEDFDLTERIEKFSKKFPKVNYLDTYKAGRFNDDGFDSQFDAFENNKAYVSRVDELLDDTNYMMNKALGKKKANSK